MTGWILVANQGTPFTYPSWLFITGTNSRLVTSLLFSLLRSVNSLFTVSKDEVLTVYLESKNEYDVIPLKEFPT